MLAVGNGAWSAYGAYRVFASAAGSRFGETSPKLANLWRRVKAGLRGGCQRAISGSSKSFPVPTPKAAPLRKRELISAKPSPWYWKPTVNSPWRQPARRNHPGAAENRRAKRRALVRHFEEHGCELLREGGNHSIS